MAEFRFVMRQRRRMCDAAGRKCDGCALQGMDCGIGALSSNPDEYEDRILQWAAEHPEPVYPTWAEYLVGIGVIPHEIRLETADALMDTHLLKPIPADIAQKLGIEPKEDA